MARAGGRGIDVQLVCVRKTSLRYRGFCKKEAIDSIIGGERREHTTKNAQSFNMTAGELVFISYSRDGVQNAVYRAKGTVLE